MLVASGRELSDSVDDVVIGTSELVDGISTVVITVVGRGFPGVGFGEGRDIVVAEGTVVFAGAADGSLGVGFGSEFVCGVGFLDGLTRVNIVTVIHGLSSVPEGGGARAWRCLRTGNEVGNDRPKLYDITCGRKACAVLVGATLELVGIYISEI